MYAAANFKGHGKYRYPVYECGNRRLKGDVCPRGPKVPATVLDAEVWRRVEAVLLHPDIIRAELARLRENDPTEADLAAVDRALSGIKRQQMTLANLVATVEDAETQEPLVAKLGELAKRRKALEKEREIIIARQRTWKAAQADLDELETKFKSIAGNLASLTFQQRQLTLDALGISVKVYPADHEPRWVIDATIPINGHAEGSNQCRNLTPGSSSRSESIVYNSAIVLTSHPW